jgi:type II restriction enzyme
MSEAPFSKEKFEFAFIFASRRAGLVADKPTGRTNRGHDVTISGVPISLKTQADKGIGDRHVHISKFMELGKGEWKLELLRDHFFAHMRAYQRIFTLRAFNRPGAPMIRYELVEIPKALLERAAQGALRWAVGSKQNPIPGYCDVLDAQGQPAFQLYFDGGTERKLQIKGIRLDLCIVHAEWKFKLGSIFENPPSQTPNGA